MKSNHVTLRLTPRQARVLFEIVDGAADAGACDGGLLPMEERALQSVMTKLIDQRNKWKQP